MGQSNGRGLCRGAASLPNTHSDALIQSDLSVIYKTTLGRVSSGPVGQRVTGHPVLTEIGLSRKAPNKNSEGMRSFEERQTVF